MTNFSAAGALAHAASLGRRARLARVASAGRRLDAALAMPATEKLYDQERRPRTMGGLSRLAAMGPQIVREINERADALADRLEKIKDRGGEVAARWDGFLDSQEREADEAERALAQLSNMPPPGDGSGGKS